MMVVVSFDLASVIIIVSFWERLRKKIVELFLILALETKMEWMAGRSSVIRHQGKLVLAPLMTNYALLPYLEMFVFPSNSVCTAFDFASEAGASFMYSFSQYMISNVDSH